ncbi:MAG TPA: hypothetical protein VLV54_10405 [Thermoanaerobaculia bacterium]|nr:hypothetical protein [Thermoanaerobaculia bacterium]
MLHSIRSTPRVWPLVLSALVLVLLAVPATAEVFHVTLKNGTTVESSVQPQQASWDPNMVMLMTEVGNWVGFSKDEITDIKVVDPTAGFGVRISSTAIALGRFSNDLPEVGKNPQDELNSRYLALANKTLELQEKQQHYSIQQGVQTEQTQGIPAAFAGYGAGYGGNGMTSNVMPPQGGQPVVTVQPQNNK